MQHNRIEMLPVLLQITTPDTLAECFDGVSESLYAALWELTTHYAPINYENCGPSDVIGINSIASFWWEISADHQAELIAIAQAEDEREEREYLAARGSV